MKNLINKFKKKISSNSGCSEPQHKNQSDDQKGIISDYLGQKKVVLEKEESMFHFPRNPQYSWERFPLYKNALQPAFFAPCKKGDVLIWHHNLIHGGSEIKDKKKTRKSLVSHYFAKDVIAYHEVTGRKLENYDPYEVVAKKES